jgi:colanic acid/amylovoran biosynthesis protein
MADRGDVRVFLIGAHPFAASRGAAALCISAIDAIRAGFPSSSVTVCGHMPERTDPRASMFPKRYGGDRGITVRESPPKPLMGRLAATLELHAALLLAAYHRASASFFGGRLPRLAGNRILEDMQSCDVVADMKWGDGFTDLYGLTYAYPLVLESMTALLAGKPYVLLPQTIGPFGNPFMRAAAGAILRRADVVMARDEESLRCAIGLGANAVLVPDLAFILRPEEPSGAGGTDAGKALCMGGNVLGMALRDVGEAGLGGSDGYMECMVGVARRLMERRGCRVLLIPHEGSAGQGAVDEMFCSNFGAGEITRLDGGEYSAEELKWLIGRCGFLLSAYMHASIGALSCGTPTAYLSYSRKAGGIFKMAGRHEYVLDLRELTLERLTGLIDSGWAEGGGRWDGTARVAESLGEEARKAVVAAVLLCCGASKQRGTDHPP